MTENPRTIDLDHTISQVTVYEDRADVVRVAVVDLPAGAHALRFVALSPLIDEARLVARFEGGAGVGHVDDVVVVRRVVDDGLDDILRRREARGRVRDQINSERRAATDDVDHSVHAQGIVERALALWTRAEGRRLGRGDDGANVDDALQKFRLQLHQAAEAVATAQARLARLDERLRKIQLDDDRKEPSRQRRVCDVIVRVSSTGGSARVVLTTIVPCAAWRPTHEARLLRSHSGASAASGDAASRAQGQPAAAGTVRFLTHGAVWNRTGEHWRGARLVLSTARPALGAELPPLSEDRLRLRQKTAEERKTIVVEQRTERVPPSATQGGAPGVDDGGEARVFSVVGADIPDDGRPHAVALASFEAPCALDLVAVPERATQVFLRASFKNSGRGPILAGPVTLVDDGAWVGTGDVLFTGAGDDLDLSFGSDDRLATSITRRLHTEKKLVGKNIEHWIREVTLTSTAPTTLSVLVLLRLPVSELAQVKVLQSPHHGTEGEVKVDSHGLARVVAVVEPGKERRVGLAWSYETSGDVQLPPPW